MNYRKKLQINGLEVEASYSKETVETVFLPLLNQLLSLQKEKNRRILIFFSAPPATGKSTLMEVLPELAREHFDTDQIETVGIDGFHYYNDVLIEKNLKQEKGSVRSFDVEKLYQTLEKLTLEKEVKFPVYDRRLHNPVEEAVTLSRNIIILEGNYLSSPDSRWQSLLKFCDFSIFLGCHGEDLKERLISRKIASGHSQKEAEDFYEASDRRNVEYVLAHSTKTDLELYLDVKTNEFSIKK